MSDDNDDINDEAFSDAADEIDNLMEGIGTQESSPEEKEKTAEERRQLQEKQSPQMTPKRQKKLSEVYDDLCDDSEEGTSEMPRLDATCHATLIPVKEDTRKQPPSGRKPTSSEELLSDLEDKPVEGHQSTSNQDLQMKRCDATVEHSNQEKCRGRKPKKAVKSGNSTIENVSINKNLKGSSEDIFRLSSSTLSEDSGDSDDENIDSKNASSSDLKALPPIERHLLSPAQRGPEGC